VDPATSSHIAFRVAASRRLQNPDHVAVTSLAPSHSIICQAVPARCRRKHDTDVGVDGRACALPLGALKQHAAAGVCPHLGDAGQLSILLAMAVGFRMHRADIVGEPFERAGPGIAGQRR
jgi:hypothetical protein